MKLFQGSSKIKVPNYFLKNSVSVRMERKDLANVYKKTSRHRIVVGFCCVLEKQLLKELWGPSTPDTAAAIVCRF